MTQQSSKHNPKIDWGFYAVTPRIVRTRYKELSHAEKWLYCCLKDLCGDKGTCFRTLRSLAEETDISIGSLSMMIPHLHAVGLIHAEKKSRGHGGKEIWHISIVDIWQANKDYCSKNEQSQEDVQEMNKDVQILNDKGESCSENERSCSNFVDRRITLKNNNTEERTSEEESVPVSSSHPPLSQDAIALATPPPVFAMEEKEKERPIIPSSQPFEQKNSLPQASDMTPNEKEQPANLVQHAKVTQASPPAKPVRKPKVAKEGVPSPERIEAVFVCMDATIRRLTKQDDFTFGRTKKAREAIRDLLSGRSVSPEKLDWHITRLWNKPKDERSGFYWRENLSVVAICNNYDREIVNYKPPLHVVPPPTTPTEPPVDKSKIFSMKPLFHLAPKPPLRRFAQAQAQAQKAEVAP